MTRTATAVLTLSGALVLAGCSSHHSTGAAATTTPASPSSAGASAAGSSASGAPVASAPASAGGASASTGTGSASAAPSGAATSPSSPAAPASTAAPATSATTSATSTASTRCLNSHLKVTLGRADAGAGQIYTPIVFTNTGSTACTLAGHPGVTYVAGDDGHQVGASATRDKGSITTVRIAPGESASAILHEANYQNFDQATCRPVEVRGLRVYPPGSKAAVFLPRPGKQCSATTLPDPAMTIAVVKAGTGA